MDSSPSAPSVNSTLVLDPPSLEGVASAYRYKVNLKNEALVGATFRFCDNLDVFSFSAVDKKRALKKEEWPVVGTVDAPNFWDVEIQLMAGETEIRNCDGCASWKDKTRKPFLVLSPTGERILQFTEYPFILVIFRCCPKFHSCNKQFRLVITVRSPTTGETFSNAVSIFRKKMVPSKKRKDPAALSPIFKKPLVNPYGSVESGLPVFPYSNTTVPVVPTQVMYRLLYSGEDKSPTLGSSMVTSYLDISSMERCSSPLLAPILHPIKLEPQVSKPFWNLDTHPNHIANKEQPVTFKVEITNDEQWLDSILNNSLEVEVIPSTLDDITDMLDLPSNQMFLSSEALY